MFNMMTLDGFFSGLNGELNWHNTDEEFQEFAIEQIKTNGAGMIIFGRRTYEFMEAFWPTEEAKKTDPITAEYMNSTPKVVFSRTLAKATWDNTKIINGDVVEAILNLKKEPGKDMIIFGSANLCSTLTSHGLIDEYSIMVNPVVLGKGVPLFQNVDKKLDLKLIKTRIFKNGNVLLSYVRKA